MHSYCRLYSCLLGFGVLCLLCCGSVSSYMLVVVYSATVAALLLVMLIGALLQDCGACAPSQVHFVSPPHVTLAHAPWRVFVVRVGPTVAFAARLYEGVYNWQHLARTQSTVVTELSTA